MVGLSTAPLPRFYAPPLQAPGGWYMSLWANYVLVRRWYSANLPSSRSLQSIEYTSNKGFGQLSEAFSQT